MSYIPLELAEVGRTYRFKALGKERVGVLRKVTPEARGNGLLVYSIEVDGGTFGVTVDQMIREEAVDGSST